MRNSPGVDWHQLCFEHEPFVRELARNLVKDENEADDVIQETWLRSIRFPPKSFVAPRSWLAKVCSNLVKERFRSEDRRRRRESHAANKEETFDREPREDEMRLLKTRLSHALGGLGAHYEDVLYLRYLGQKSPKTIASQLDLPIETVHTRLKRGRKLLRGRLDRDYGSRTSWGLVAIGLFGRRTHAPATASATALTLVTQGVLMLLPFALFFTWLFLAGPPPETRSPDGLAAVLPPAEPLVAEVLEPQPRLRAAVPVEVRPEAVPLAPAAPRETQVRVRTLHPDGRVATGVTVLSFGRGETRPAKRVTDENGLATFADIEAGDRTFLCEGGQEERVRLQDGEAHEVDLTVDGLYDIRGTVVDYQGRPAPGAEVLVTWPRPFDHILLPQSTVADSEGNFELEQVGRYAWVRAREEGGLDSMRASLDTPAFRSDPPEHLTIELPRPGTMLSGRVLGDAGKPLEGAQVRIRSEYLRLGVAPPFGPDGSRRLPVEPTPARTDEEGRFEIRGIDPEWARVVLMVDAKEHAPLRVTAALDGTDVELRLEPESVIDGRIVGPAGKPAAAARIQVTAHSTGAVRYRRTNPDGRFRVEGLGAGVHDLEVVSDRQETAGTLRTEVVLMRAEELEFEGELTREAPLRGRLVDGRGRPLSGWNISLESERAVAAGRVQGRFEDGRMPRRTTTPRDGRFEFYGCTEESYLLRAFAPGDTTGIPAAWRWDTRPGARRWVLKADKESEPTASLSGLLHLRDESIPRGAEVQVYSALLAKTFRVPVDPITGHFEVGHLLPDRYTLFAWVPGRPPWEITDLELEPSERHDCGLVLPPRTGSLAFQVETDDGEEIRDGRVQLAVPGHSRYDAFLGSGMVRFADLPEGRYAAVVFSEGRAPWMAELDYRPGESPDVDIVLERAVRVVIAVTDSVETSRLQAVTLYVYDEQQRLVLSHLSRSPGDLVCSFRCDLAPGTYSARVENGAGRRAVSRIDVVPDADRPLPPFRMVLR